MLIVTRRNIIILLVVMATSGGFAMGLTSKVTSVAFVICAGMLCIVLDQFSFKRAVHKACTGNLTTAAQSAHATWQLNGLIGSDAQVFGFVDISADASKACFCGDNVGGMDTQTLIREQLRDAYLFKSKTHFQRFDDRSSAGGSKRSHVGFVNVVGS